MNDYITLTQLAAHYRVTRPVMERRLIQVGLCRHDRTPSEQALRRGVCKTLPTWGRNKLLLWHWKKTVAALTEGVCRHPDDYPGDWATPDWLFNLLDAEFHFTLDAAASPHNAKCKRFWTEEENGLAQNWGREIVWCNPPFSVRIMAQWVRKAYEASRSGATVVVLMPLWLDYEWFERFCAAYGEIRLVLTKVCFRSPAGQIAGKFCLVVVFRPDARSGVFGPSIRKPKAGRRA
jgi:phage N-6-adenine-methyltransferase